MSDDFDFDDRDPRENPPPSPRRSSNPGDTPPRGSRRAVPPEDAFEGDEYDDPGDTPPRARPRASAPPPYPPPPPPSSQGAQPRRPRNDPRSDYYDEPPRGNRRPEPAPYYPPDTRRPPKPKPNKRESGLYLPWWSLVIMLVFVGCAAVGALLVVNSLDTSTQAKDSTPVIIVITSTFTIGPPASPTSISLPATLTPTAPLPTIAPSASLPPGDFGVGKIVQVVGSGESGLNIHNAAGVSAPIVFRAKDGDRFVIQGGPSNLDGYEWWQIQDQNNSSRIGWAARNFLQSIGTPVPTPGSSST